MKYNIKVNEVKSEDSQFRAFATVTFGDSLVVRNIAIIERRDSGTFESEYKAAREQKDLEKKDPVPDKKQEKTASRKEKTVKEPALAR